MREESGTKNGKQHFAKLLQAKVGACLHARARPHQVAQVGGRLNLEPAQIMNGNPGVTAGHEHFKIRADARVRIAELAERLSIPDSAVNRLLLEGGVSRLANMACRVRSACSALR